MSYMEAKKNMEKPDFRNKVSETWNGDSVALLLYTFISQETIIYEKCNGISISTHTQFKVEYWISDSHQCS